MEENAFYFDDFKVTADNVRFYVHQRKIIRNSKDKSKIGKERWEKPTYHATLESVFSKISQNLCKKHIGDLSLAIEKINELRHMLKKITDYE